MDAILYLLGVGIGGMVLASIAILMMILIVAFTSWNVMWALDVLKRLASTYPQAADRLRPSSYKSLRLRDKKKRRLRLAR